MVPRRDRKEGRGGEGMKGKTVKTKRGRKTEILRLVETDSSFVGSRSSTTLPGGFPSFSGELTPPGDFNNQSQPEEPGTGKLPTIVSVIRIAFFFAFTPILAIKKCTILQEVLQEAQWEVLLGTCETASTHLAGISHWSREL